MVGHQVCRDLVQVGFAKRSLCLQVGGAQKAKVGFLQEVVCQFRFAARLGK